MDIQVITDEQLPAEFQYPNIYLAPNFEEASKRFREWCEANQVFYYARPRESFFRYEAFELAAAANCTKLLLEDMS